MVRRYEKRVSAFPHARLPTEFYERLVVLSIFRHSPGQIALALNAPIQTVNRNLAYLRRATTESDAFWRTIAERIDRVMWVDTYPVMSLLSAFETLYVEEDPQKHNIDDLFMCLMGCPRSENPRKFAESRVSVINVDFNAIELLPNFTASHLFRQLNDSRDLRLALSVRKKCRFCALGRAQSDVMRMFEQAGHAYVDVLVHLAQHRIRKDFYYNLCYALALGQIQTLFAIRNRRDLAAGIPEKEAEVRLGEEVRDLVGDIFEILSQYQEDRDLRRASVGDHRYP